jgi:hypothetical protein
MSLILNKQLGSESTGKLGVFSIQCIVKTYENVLKTYHGILDHLLGIYFHIIYITDRNNSFLLPVIIVTKYHKQFSLPIILDLHM